MERSQPLESCADRICIERGYLEGNETRVRGRKNVDLGLKLNNYSFFRCNKLFVGGNRWEVFLVNLDFLEVFGVEIRYEVLVVFFDFLPW